MLTTIADELRPETDRVDEATRRARALINELKDKERTLIIQEHLQHGSHARDTAILGFKDIDYLLVLDEAALKAEFGDVPGPRDTIAGLADVVGRRRGMLVARGAVEVREQDHSVGVKYPKSDLRIDLVPALRTDERGCFLIPDSETNDWIETRPHRLKRHISWAEKNNGRLRSVIRLIKGWRQARGKRMRIPSYAVELLLGEWAGLRPRFDGLISHFFRELAGSDPERPLVLLGQGDRGAPVTVRDPWSKNNVAHELTKEHRTRLVENARKALNEFREAQVMATEGRDNAAMRRLRILFRSRPRDEEEEE